MLDLRHIDKVKAKLLNCDVSQFNNRDNSYRFYLNKIEIIQFRHLSKFEIEFEHPVTILAGTNKIGKTSILLLIACSHEMFYKMDATSPEVGMRIHIWRDVLEFTKYENTSRDYSYKLSWRVGCALKHGEGKRLASSKAWSGLGKKSNSDSRINAKIKDRHVRLIDLERVLPVRNFSNSLFRKTKTSTQTRLNEDIECAYSYIFDAPSIELYEIGVHVNKFCYLIKCNNEFYSSYNAASGEEAMISILKDIIEAPRDALILIDEIEAGFHPSIQRKLADIIQLISWRDKKQFIITTHSPTLISAFSQKSRKFIDMKLDGTYEVINKISKQAAFSKMDAKAYPIVNLYCEDDEAEFLIKKVMMEINKKHKYFDRLINIVKSGPADQVKNDYERHKRNFTQFRHKIRYCCVFDGDYREKSDYSNYHNDKNEFSFFLYSSEPPEKFLLKAYLNDYPNTELQTSLSYINNHLLFQKMVEIGLATDVNNARESCFNSFKSKPGYKEFQEDTGKFLISTVKHFSNLTD